MPLKKCTDALTRLWSLPHAPSQAAMWSHFLCLFPWSLGICEATSFQSWQEMALHLIFYYRSSVSFNFDFLGFSLYTLLTFASKFPVYIYLVFKVWIWAKRSMCGFFFYREYGFK